MKQEKNIWEQSRVELFQKLDCRETGLSQEDAADRLAKYGANELHAGKQKSVLQIFLGQFADFLVLILILAAVISACMGDVESMIVILAVITMNAILGTVQTVKASASLDSLKQMSAPTAKVLRDGQIVQIPGREVVPGDVVILEAGDSVCADGRLLECASLKCAESALTGESLPVEKAEGSDVGIYEVGKRVKNRFRFLEAHDMTIEAVITKVMWLLAQNCESFDQLQQRFYRQINFDTFYH